MSRRPPHGPLLAAILAALALPAGAETVILPVPADPAAVLTVTPDRPDWTYPAGAQAAMRVRLSLKPYPAGGVPIRYRLGPDMREGAERSALVPEGGLVLPVGPQQLPGFVRAIVKAEVAGKEVSTSATAAFAPDAIRATQQDAADFDRFWNEQKALLAKVAPDYKLTPAPALSTDKVETFYVSMQNVGRSGGTSRIYGVLCVPRGEGPFPAVLHVPGAGVRGYKGAPELAERGMITLQIGIHGIPVDQGEELYEAMRNGALADYPRYELDNRERYYYRRVYLGAVRANDFLTSHPKWNGRSLTVVGGSQGGQLAIVTAALDSRVTGLAAHYPAYSDVSGYAHGGTGGWPHLFKPGADGKPGDQPVSTKLDTTRYYDTVNFARRLKAPGFYAMGYNDQVTPPTSVYAAFNAIAAPKEIVVAPQMGHFTSDEQMARRNEWILRQAGIAK